MGIALWRSRCVSRWIAVLFVVGTEVAQQVPSAGPVKVIVLMAPFAVALILLAIRIWRDADASDRAGSEYVDRPGVANRARTSRLIVPRTWGSIGW